MSTFCQVIILIFVVLGFFRCLWMDFNGVKARKPYGYSGAIATVIITALIVLIYWKAGAFSELLP